jgi:nitrogen fixation protein NifX
MNDLNIDKDTALRIALAARAMPDVELPTLLEVLDDRLGRPLNLAALARITVTDLKTGLGSADGEEDGEDIGIGLDALKLAVRILWGETQEDDSLPKPEAYAEGDMPRSIRVAISSNSGVNLDGHFGSCLRYLVYQVSAEEIRLVDIRSSAEADFSDDRNAFRASLIKDCQVVYVVSVGGPAAAKIIRAGVYPIKRIEGGEAMAVLVDLQGVMESAPPPWLAKILGVAQKERLRNYTGEEVES